MKFMVALAFTFLLVQDSNALVSPKPQELTAIDAKIAKVKAAMAILETKRRQLADAEDDERRKASLGKEIADQEKIQKKAAEQALWMTIRAYGLLEFNGNSPILVDGTSVLPSPENGKSIKWLPVFADIGENLTQDWKGAPAAPRTMKPNVAGNTASDGISRIFPQAFLSPAELASTIIHEKIHFVQNTTRGKGDQKTLAELEVEAYEEELRLLDDPNNILRYSKKAKKRQKDVLEVILEGENGEKGKRDIAKDEREVANRMYGGRPFAEHSLLSHSEEDIKRLIQEAKAQVEIAQKDHDARLRRSWLALAKRTCNDPESVTQEDVDALPVPDKMDYFRDVPYPADERPCMKVYLYLGGGGRDAEAIRNIARPAPAYVAPEPVMPVSARAATPISEIFPRLATFSVAACRGDHMTVPYMQDIYEEQFALPIVSNEADDRYGESLVKDLDVCSRNLFWNIVEKMRKSHGRWEIEPGWIDMVISQLPPPSYQAPAARRPVAPPVVPPVTRPAPPINDLPPQRQPPQHDPHCGPENGVWGCPK